MLNLTALPNLTTVNVPLAGCQSNQRSISLLTSQGWLRLARIAIILILVNLGALLSAPALAQQPPPPAKRALTNEDFPDSRPPATTDTTTTKAKSDAPTAARTNSPAAAPPAKAPNATKPRLRPEERLPDIDRLPDNFSRVNTRYFQIVNQENTVSLELQQEILDVLENCYGELQRRLGYAPTKKIGVIFYQQQTFFDTTRAPSWAGGLNDGRIHIPVGGLQKMNASLAGVLKHELAHSFVYFKTEGNCPTWLNEGLAQLVEGKAANNNKLDPQNFPRLQDLPQGFGRLTASQAQTAYAYALLATEFLAKNGLPTVVKVLETLGQGQSIDAALSQHTRYRNLAELNSNLQASFKE